MPTTINASNTTGGAVVTGDGSGILELQSGGVTGITVNGPNVTVAGTLTTTGGISALTTPVIVTGSSTAGAEIRLPEDTDNGSNYVAIKAPDALAANVTFTLPTADGTSGQLIQTNGSGVLSFTNPTSLASPLAVVGNSTAGAEIRLPEDTDNGANYVALKAPDSLGSNLTFTLPSADGTSGQFIQTDGLGQLSFATPASGTRQFTSTGSITAGQAVSINTDGTVSATTGISQSLTYTTSQTLPYYTTFRGSYYSPSVDWHIGMYAFTSGITALQCWTWRVSSTGVVSYGGAIDLTTTEISSIRKISITQLGTSNVFAVNITGVMTPRVLFFTVNASTGAISSAGSVSLDYSDQTWKGDIYYDTNAARVVVFYGDSSTFKVAAINYNNGSPLITATNSFNMSNNNGSVCAAYSTSSNVGRMFYPNFSNSDYMWTRTVTVSSDGTTITLGTAAVSNTNYMFGCARAVYLPAIDRFVVQVASGSSTFNTFLINPSTGSAVSSTNARGQIDFYSYGFTPGVDTTNNVVYNGSANTSVNYASVWSYTFTASSLTYNAALGTSATPPNMAYGGAFSFDATKQRGLLLLTDTSTNYARMVGYLPPVFNTTADKFIGFATQSVSTGQSVTVTILGGVNANQSGLTAGVNYYLQFDGVISTTPSAYGIVAEGLNATSALITTGGAFKKIISQTVISGNPSSVIITLPSGFSQFELALQSVSFNTGSNPIITANYSGGTASWYGRGWYIYSTSSYNQYTVSASNISLSAGFTHSSGQPLGTSLLLQSSSSGSYWSYQMMTSFYNGGDSYTSTTGYLSNPPTTLTISGSGTMNSGGVITLYGIG